MIKDYYPPPFRVGKKQKRAVLDANGHKLVLFPVGREDYAQEYCDYLNSTRCTWVQKQELEFLKKQERVLEEILYSHDKNGFVYESINGSRLIPIPTFVPKKKFIIRLFWERYYINTIKEKIYETFNNILRL